MLRYSVQLSVCCGMEALKADHVKLKDLGLTRKVTVAPDGKLGALAHLKGVAVSSGGSDHGGSDTCQSSSSDTTSVSEPCSPEAGPESTSRPGTPQPMPPLPPSLSDDHDHRHRSRHHVNHFADIEDRLQDQMDRVSESLFRAISEEKSRACEKAESGPDRSDTPVTNRSQSQDADQGVPDNREPFWCSSSQDASAATELRDKFLARLEPAQDGQESFRKCLVEQVKAEPAELCDPDETSCHHAPEPPTGGALLPCTVLPRAESFCKWHNCQQEVPSDKLVDHMKSCHVDCQMENETFICLWVGCKVYNRPSCSVSWLQRHILSHGGNKPFRCIVDGCQHRFASQSALERHVNSHFNSTQANSSGLTAGHGGAGSACAGGRQGGKSKEDTPTKLIKKRKLRYRRRCWAVKTEDYFDAGVMEHVRHNLMEMESKCSLDTLGASRIVNFQSNVIARRIEDSGKVKFLLHWTPEDVFPDSWIPECQLEENARRSVPISLLPRDAICRLDPSLQSYSPPKRRRK